MITILCVLMAGAFLYGLCSYAAPSDDSIYDLTINNSRDNELIIDSRGWTVFLQEEGKKTVIVPDKDTGFYDGVDYLGQTFYYSRTFHEKLNHATLSIGAVDSNIVVFLDDEVIYTDCPQADCRIGYLTLPARESDREEGVTIALPDDYTDRTITIAQSTSVYGSDNQNRPFAIFPAEVTLYSAFAKESRLIAATLKSTIPVILLFSLSLFLMGAGLFNLYRNESRPELFALAILCFLENAKLLLTNDISDICMISSPVSNQIAGFLPYGIGLLLFIILTLQMQDPPRPLRPLMFLCFIAEFILGMIQILNISGFISLEHFSLSVFEIPLFVLTLFLCIREAIHANIFMQKMLLYSLTVFLVQIFYETITGNLLTQIRTTISSAYISFDYFIKIIQNALLCGTILSTCRSFVSETLKEYTDRQILLERSRQMWDTCENLKIHAEQTNRLIHDNRHHLIVLQDLLNQNKSDACAYINELLSNYHSIRQRAASGNELLDILLNAAIERSARTGVTVIFEKCQAPARLILSDVQACSLYMNILENAVNAAGECAYEKKIILSLYTKDRFFIFKCINTADPGRIRRINHPNKSSYGLKIITDLVNRYHGLVRIRPAGIPSSDLSTQKSESSSPDNFSAHWTIDNFSDTPQALEVMIALPLADTN